MLCINGTRTTSKGSLFSSIEKSNGYCNIVGDKGDSEVHQQTVGPVLSRRSLSESHRTV